jgi:hypothetical protein
VSRMSPPRPRGETGGDNQRCERKRKVEFHEQTGGSARRAQSAGKRGHGFGNIFPEARPEQLLPCPVSLPPLTDFRGGERDDPETRLEPV